MWLSEINAAVDLYIYYIYIYIHLPPLEVCWGRYIYIYTICMVCGRTCTDISIYTYIIHIGFITMQLWCWVDYNIYIYIHLRLHTNNIWNHANNIYIYIHIYYVHILQSATRRSHKKEWMFINLHQVGSAWISHTHIYIYTVFMIGSSTSTTETCHACVMNIYMNRHI